MPSRNVTKIYLENSYYHVYNRGVNKRKIFLDKDDYAVFLNLCKRYLGEKPAHDRQGREYPWLHNTLDLLAFCLMPNHFHFLVFQKKEETMTELLRCISTSYSRYFNKKYRRIGPLFQNCYRASLIDNDTYLEHITRYIHLNSKAYKEWEFSSLPYYLGHKQAHWVTPKTILELFADSPKVAMKKYREFMEDYEDYKQMLDDIKAELA